MFNKHVILINLICICICQNIFTEYVVENGDTLDIFSSNEMEKMGKKLAPEIPLGTVIGLGKLVKELFNKEIGKITVLILIFYHTIQLLLHLLQTYLFFPYLIKNLIINFYPRIFNFFFISFNFFSSLPERYFNNFFLLLTIAINPLFE